MGEVIANSPTPGVAAQLTTLGSSIASSGTTTITTSAAVTGALLTGVFRILVGDGVQNAGAYEAMLVTAGQSGTSWTVTRGVESSTATTWNNATPIYHAWTAAGVAAAMSAYPLTAPASGTFLRLPFANGTLASASGLVVNGTVVYYPFAVANTPTVTAMSAFVVTGGSAGAVFRMGLYYDSNAKPGAVLLDAGTVAATSSAATATISGLSTALAPGRYWAALVEQGAPGTNITPRSVLASGQQVEETVQPDTLAHATTPTAYCAYSQTGVTGSFSTATSLTAADAGGGVVRLTLLVLTF